MPLFLIWIVGISVAMVPLFDLLCNATSYFGSANATDVERISDPKRMIARTEARPINVHFSASRAKRMLWHFKPLQTTITLTPGKLKLSA